MAFLTVVVLVAILLFVVDRYLLNYWRRQNIPQGKPKSLFGDFKDAFLHKKSMAEVVQSIYMQSKQHRIFGVFISYRPMLFINDPKIISDIMLKDFRFFPDRGLHVNEHFDPLSDQLFFQGGRKWRMLRAVLTPAFTPAKLKAMLPIVSKNGEILLDFIDKAVQDGSNVFDFRDLIARLNTNIIVSVAFGLEVDTINDPKHVMRQVGVKVFEPSFMAGLRFFASFFTPAISNLLKFKFVNNEVESFFTTIIMDNVALREKNKFHRNDLMQTMIQLKNEGLKDGSEINLNDICAQSFGFYLGGFETTSSTVTYCLYELARNQDVQRKAQMEIDDHFKITDDSSKLYEIIKDMKYLECCMNEALRKYSPLPLLSRECASDYHISESDLVIRKGTPCIIPIFGLQRDADIFKDPLTYRPERFLNNPKGSEVAGSYFLPFGEGSRVCIGHKMGKQNTKFQLALLLSKFNFKLAIPREREINFNPNQLFLQPLDNIHLRVSPRINSI